MIEYSDFVSSIKKEEEDKVTTAISNSWNALNGLSYGAGLKVITSTLDKVQVVFKERVVKLVSEDDYGKALNDLIILNSATELFKASTDWQEEVYRKLLLESKEESHKDNNSSSNLPSSGDNNSVQYSSSSSLRPSGEAPAETKGSSSNTKATQEQKRWAVLQTIYEVNNKQRNNVLNRAIVLMAESGWPVSTKVALRNVLAGLLTSSTPGVEYINLQKAKYRGIQLTTYGQHLLQSLTYQLKP